MVAGILDNKIRSHWKLSKQACNGLVILIADWMCQLVLKKKSKCGARAPGRDP